MISLPLTNAEMDSLLATLVESHEVRLDVSILNRNEKVIDSLSTPASMVIDGSVQVDATADVSRSLSLTLLDPKHKLTFDSTNPSKGAMYADNFIRVEYEVYVPDLLRWVSIPVFQGPLTTFKRDGHVVAIEAQGKETLLLAPHYATKSYSIRKGTRLDNAIKLVARRVGERRFNIPRLTAKLHKHRSVLPASEPWKVIAGGEQDANGHNIPGLIDHAAQAQVVFYNGRGELTVKKANQSSVYTFGDSTLVSPPSLEYDTLSFINHVKVRGGVPKGAKHHARGAASLPGSNPLSPSALARNDQPRYLTAFVEATNLKTDAQCDEHADRYLKAHSTVGVAASFECLPIPMLEEGDNITLSTSEYRISFTLKQFTIPLTSGSPMSIGVNKRVRAKR